MNSHRCRGLVVLGLLVVLALVWQRSIDGLATASVDAGLQRSLATFAVARGMNAVISLAQGASVSVQLGAGASLHPGAVLDPVDDLVEQFSALMLAATLSFATQRLLIEIFSAWQVCALLSGTLLAWAAYGWRGRRAPTWLARIAIAGLCLRLAVPAIALGSEAIYQGFLAEEYGAAQAQAEQAERAEVAAPPARPNEGFVEGLRDLWAQGADIGKKIGALKATADGWVEHLIKLAAVFAIQTILLPLLFIGAMVWLYRALVSAASISGSHS